MGSTSSFKFTKMLIYTQKEGVTPDTHTVGVLLRDAAGRLDYECLTALMKVRFLSDFKFEYRSDF